MSDFLPGLAAIAGFIESASCAAAIVPPWLAIELPHAGKDDVRIGWIDVEIGSAILGIGIERLAPGLARIRRKEDATVRIGAEGMTHGCNEDAAWIARVQGNARDGHRLVKAAVIPSLAAVVGVVHAAADGDAVAYVRFTGSHPDGIGMFGIDGDVADGNGVWMLKDRLPRDAAIHGLKKAAGAGGGVKQTWISRDAFDAGNASAHGGRTDASPFESIEERDRPIIRRGRLSRSIQN